MNTEFKFKGEASLLHGRVGTTIGIQGSLEAPIQKYSEESSAPGIKPSMDWVRFIHVRGLI